MLSLISIFSRKLADWCPFQRYGEQNTLVPEYLSQDSLVKIWHMESQHCVQTLTGHRGHVIQCLYQMERESLEMTNLCVQLWSLGVNMAGNLLITGGNDAELRVW